jgi:DNA mismatch repair protein MutL
LEFIDELTDEISSRQPNPESILARVASMACKAAVKANHRFSTEEASSLIKELLSLENPYHCPHGRPVIISMSQYELEKKFKRII